MRYKVWNKVDNLITPIGEILPPQEVFNRYPMATLDHVKMIICDTIISMGVFMEFTQTIQHYETVHKLDFSSCVIDQDFLDVISDFEENPPEQPPTIEERTAAALEFANILAMPSIE